MKSKQLFTGFAVSRRGACSGSVGEEHIRYGKCLHNTPTGFSRAPDRLTEEFVNSAVESSGTT